MTSESKGMWAYIERVAVGLALITSIGVAIGGWVSGEHDRSDTKLVITEMKAETKEANTSIDEIKLALAAQSGDVKVLGARMEALADKLNSVAQNSVNTSQMGQAIDAAMRRIEERLDRQERQQGLDGKH